MNYRESNIINLYVLLSHFTYRTIVEDFEEFVGDITLGTLSNRCKRLGISKKIAVDWCNENGITEYNYKDFLTKYYLPKSRFEELEERCENDFSKFRHYYATMDWYSIMERYSIGMDDFKFLCKKYSCTGRRKWDEKNGRAVALAFNKLTDVEFIGKFGFKKTHPKVQHFVQIERDKRASYQRNYREKQKDNIESTT